MKVFVVDLSRCNGCHNCQIVCKDEHVDNQWLPYAEPQPDTGQFWVRVEEKVHGSTPKVKISYTPLLCNHCANAPCMEAAKDGAVYRRGDGLVIVDPAKARGQRAIAEACPYGAVFYNEGLGLPQKCTGCAHLLDDGWEVPRCVDACATEALRYIEEEELASLYPDARPLDDPLGCQPRVYYANDMKEFVAGTVFDPIEQEVIVGAAVTLLDEDKKTIATTESDGFGDFRFEGLDAGLCCVRIEADGFDDIETPLSEIGSSMNVGDIPMKRS